MSNHTTPMLQKLLEAFQSSQRPLTRQELTILVYGPGPRSERLELSNRTNIMQAITRARKTHPIVYADGKYHTEAR